LACTVIDSPDDVVKTMFIVFILMIVGPINSFCIVISSPGFIEMFIDSCICGSVATIILFIAIDSSPVFLTLIDNLYIKPFTRDILASLTF
jgi:hypothetical protein